MLKGDGVRPSIKGKGTDSVAQKSPEGAIPTKPKTPTSVQDSGIDEGLVSRSLQPILSRPVREGDSGKPVADGVPKQPIATELTSPVSEESPDLDTAAPATQPPQELPATGPSIEKRKPAVIGSVRELRSSVKTKDETEQETRSYPFSLYLGSLPYPELAEKAVSQYRKEGVSAYWVKVILSIGTWYRVYTGYFQNRQRAERFKEEKGLKEATVQETPYANLIGVYTNVQELDNKVQSLKSLGFSPYSIKDRDGKSRLFVGAFFPERRAKRQRDDLKSCGIDCQIVRR